MANANVIRDFFVALGFKTNDSEAGKMQETLLSTEAKAKLLNKALIGLGVAAVVGVAKTARELDKLHYASKRIGADASNVQAYGDAISQLGGDAESAVASLESVAQKIRNSPGYEEMIKGLGVVTRDENGGMRDRVEVLKDLSGTLSKMPHYQANAYAQSLGVDEQTLMAMRDGRFLSSMEKYQKLRKEMGMTDELAQAGSEFMVESRELGMAVKGVSEVLLMTAGKVLIPVLKLVNKTIQGTIHWFSELNPAIKSTLAAGLKFAMLAVVFGGFLRSLMMLKKGLILLKSFIPVLKMLRLAFLASPLGIILALAAAIALLWNDYKTWKEGGKSLFDWSKWTGGIDKIISKIKDFINMLNKIKDKVINFIKRVIDDPVGAAIDVAEGAKAALAAVADSETVKDVVKAGQDFIEDVVENGVVDAVVNAGTAIVEKGKGFLEGVVDNFIEVDQIKPNRQETPKNAADLAAFATAQGVPQASINLNNGVMQGLNAIINTANIVNEGARAVAVAGNSGYAKKAPIKSGAKGEKQIAFIEKYWGMAVRIADALNVEPEFILSQFAAETGWGKSVVPGTNNLGNIKAGSSWKGATVKAYDKIEKSNDPYRVYATPEDFADDYIKLVGNSKRYKGVIGSRTAEKFYGELKSAGYATDKDYVKKGVEMNKSVTNRLDMSKTKASIQSEKIQSLIPELRSISPPLGNPDRSQLNNSAINASNITIHQSFQTDMTLNGVSSPAESANAMKRQQENSLAFMARGVKSVIA